MGDFLIFLKTDKYSENSRISIFNYVTIGRNQNIFWNKEVP